MHTDSSIAKVETQISLNELFALTKDWFSFLISKWLIIVGFGIVGVLIGFGYAFFKKTIYKATTTFVLEESEKGGGLGQYAGIASMVGIDIGGGSGIFQGDNILELYKSRTMIENTLLTRVKDAGDSILLVDQYIKAYRLREKWSDKPKLKSVSFSNLSEKSRGSATRLQDSVLGVLVTKINKDNLVVSRPDKKLSIIKVEVNSVDELFSKAFNNEIVKNVNDFYIVTKTKKSNENVTILQHKTDSVRAVMNGTIYAAAVVSDATPNLNPTRMVQRNAPVQRAQFGLETNKAMLSELIKNLELSKISLLKETPLIQVIDEPVYPLEEVKASKIAYAALYGFLISICTIAYLVLRRISRQFK